MSNLSRTQPLAMITHHIFDYTTEEHCKILLVWEQPSHPSISNCPENKDTAIHKAWTKKYHKHSLNLLKKKSPKNVLHQGTSWVMWINIYKALILSVVNQLLYNHQSHITLPLELYAEESYAVMLYSNSLLLGEVPYV